MPRAWLLGAGLLLVWGALPAQADDLANLKKAADKVLADPDTVRSAKSAGQVFSYADAAEAKGAGAEAADYRAKGLRLQPWNLGELLSLAQRLSATGQADDARVKLQTVEKYGETDALKEGALKSLGLAIPWAPPEEAKRLEGSGPVVVLAPIGTVDVWLLRQMAFDLTGALGIPVFVMDFKVPLGIAERTGRSRWLHLVRHDMADRPDAQKFMVATAKQLGINPDLMADDDTYYRVLLAYAEQSPQREYAEGVRLSNQAAMKEAGQWNVATLMKALKNSSKPYGRKGLVVLGVTAEDIYGGDSNFLFATAEPGFGVISYQRFTAAATGETPKAARLALRLKKQALSSAGFGFEVQRCTTAWCARAYANSLEQQDAKEGKLCDLCREGFKRAFHKLGWDQPLPAAPDDLN